jgi:hypothetical protein
VIGFILSLKTRYFSLGLAGFGAIRPMDVTSFDGWIRLAKKPFTSSDAHYPAYYSPPEQIPNGFTR